MNDIRVKIVETPRNPSGDVPATPPADVGHHNEVDPLAFDDTEVLAVKKPLDTETEAENDKLKGQHVKVDRCDEITKEKVETLPLLPAGSDSVKVLNAQCDKIKEELLKDDTSSIDSSIDDISKAEDINHEEPPSSTETHMESEDSLPEKVTDLLTIETTEKLEVSHENHALKPPTLNNEEKTLHQNTDAEKTESSDQQALKVTKELIKEPSLVKEINQVISSEENIIPNNFDSDKESTSEELVKEVISTESNLSEEVFSNKVTIVKEETLVKDPEDTFVKDRKPAKEIVNPQIPVSHKEVLETIPEKKLIKVKDESKLKETFPVKQIAPIQKEPIKEKSPIREVITLAEAFKIRDSVQNKTPEPVSATVDVKVRDVEMLEVPQKPHTEVKNEKPLEVAKPEGQAAVNGSVAKDELPVKRRASEEAETDSPLKKLCREIEKTFPQHDTMINEFIQTTTQNNIDEIQRYTEQLLSEIQTLRELAQKKEHEWNNILHLKKVKEEILLRLLRRKQVLSFEKSVEVQNGSNCKDPFDYLNQVKNLAIDKSDEISGLVLKQPTPPASVNIPSPVHMPPQLPVPVTTHFNPMSGLPPPYDKAAHMQSMSKPVFPQSLMMPGPTMPFPRDMNGQMTNFGLPMGRQGPTKDVKSIIADYRQRNPDVTPRRGRRMKSILNPNMMNQPRQIAPKLDNLNNLNNLNNLGMIFNNLDMNQKAMLERLTQMQAGSLPAGMSFKDVLVQYANLQQSAGLVPPAPGPRPDIMSLSRPESHQTRGEPPGRRRERAPHAPHAQHAPPPPLPQHEDVHISVRQTERLPASSPRLPPPPPYPEISLLPVSSQEQACQQNSLLHGILTKQASPSPQSYSPTLAKLLTSPERRQSAPPLPAFGQAKNCGEITITPVQPPPPPPPEAQPEKPDEVVQLDEDERASEGSTEDSPEGAGGRLVIDEASAPPAEASDAPLCQGCRRRDAQFVCAGCANQWYCSRDCQVAAWDEHSDMCSG